MHEEVKCVRIPVFDNIRCISKEDFEQLPDKRFYQVISEEPDGKLLVGHFAPKKKK